MGYRLGIRKCKLIYYGTKLFGYVDDEQLTSLKYLQKIGKIDEDCLFTYGINNAIVLDREEMKIFIRLYNEDMNKFDEYYKEDCFINEDTIKSILNDKETEYYVIDWG